MARRLIVDTGILIASERSRASLAEVVEDGDDLVIAAVTVAELRTGVELAAQGQRQSRQEYLRRILDTLPVEPYDVAVAEAHGRLLAAVYRTGRRRGAHDLIIAATALATDRIILTRDRRAQFDDLPGVECLMAG